MVEREVERWGTGEYRGGQGGIGLPTPRDGNKGPVPYLQGRIRDRPGADRLGADMSPRRRSVGRRRAWHGTVELVVMGRGV